MNPQLQTMLQQAIQAFQSGNFDSADLILKRVLQADSKNLPALHILGLIKASQANHKEAADFLGRAARIHPNDASIQYNLAKALADSGNNKDAIAHHKKAVALAANNPEAWLNYGKSASNLGRYEDALVWFGKALSLKPDYAEALLNKGAILKVLKKLEEAIALAEQALSINPNLVEAWSNKGGALKELKRFDEAVIHYDKAISLKPDYHEAWSNKGVTLHELKRFDEAIAHYDKALSLKSDYAEAWSNKGATLHELKRYDEAIAHYDKAISLKPDYHETWSNKGVALYELNQFDEAITHYDKALSLKPDYHEAWANKGSTLNLLKKHSESAKCFQKALELNSKDSYLLGKAHHQMMLGCDWSNYEKNINEIFNLANEGRKGAEPFGFQGISSSEELLKKCAEIYSNDVFPPLGNLSKVSQYNHHKIRVGYLCGEFRNQATSILMTRVWELHNKSKFEIFAFDNGWDDDSDYRHRIAGAFSNIFDISRLSDLDAAKLIQHNEIDILVNLNGFFGYARQGIFSYKPAPIQVNYLGFPGTMGVKYMDYIIADKVVIPEESKIHYVEKLAYLPNSYQANDDMRTISDRKFSKAELGLPEDAFVFACFNNNYKITPTVFDSWLRILSLVQGSVLWLLADNPTAKDNLIKEAFSRGIDSSRLVFAERLPISEHLARHDLADLFLDTLPYNAHTTCSDALWVGLPVLTLMGHTFPGRVSASLLSAMGLSELVTHTQEEYEALAVELAMNRQKLADIKVKLAKNRLSTPLFNTPLFTKNIEAAYMKMMERYQADLEPDHIFVT
jgi:predicted O-linked N-acetylglucosamine transferase (SPINDLY family)